MTNEARLYNRAMWLGVGILLLGLWRHSWFMVAAGALIAGIGGIFSAFSH
ncbi:MAG: hypothetical protein U0X75_04810 [Acidobacteriota bacterium]